MADNWYEIMELSPGASPADIKKQYHFLCKVWHPDRFSGDSDKARAEEKMKKVNAAYEVLSDPRKRANYDAGRASQGDWEQKQRQDEERRRQEQYRRHQEEERQGQESQAKQSQNAQYTGLWRQKRFFPVLIALAILVVVWMVNGADHRNSSPTTQTYTNSTQVVDANKTKLAAERGEANAQVNLGFMYEKGQGVLQDYEEAVKWYLKAAEQGNTYAQINLGHMYVFGQGVPQNNQKALKWYRLAAEQGNVIGQKWLALRYYDGHGVPQNYVDGYAWLIIASWNSVDVNLYKLASWKGADVDSYKRHFQKRMTASQIEAAQQRAKEIQAGLRFRNTNNSNFH